MTDFIEAMEWARTAEDGDYLAEYDEDGLTAERDPGNRCGYGDDELDEIKRQLRARGLTLDADDRGLVATRTA